MRLITIEQWRLKHFEENSRPAEITVLRWCRNFQRGLQPGIPSKKVGGTWYIDEAAWLAEGDALVEQVLAG